ncbi:30S ribosomal protein S2 [Candidatus Pacearchaeota archaeon]|nr:30S ribosomal protein S2 [Candidatus Pacearchaeota archaeon]
MPKKKKDETEEKIKNLAGEELEKAAEAESLSSDIEEKKKRILEKAKKLSAKVETTTTEDLKEQVKIKKRTDMLVPLEEYVKNAIYLGTRVVTPDMKPFIYRRRADGLAIFNTDLVDEKLKEAIEFMSKFEANEIILVCKRQSGWKVAEMMGQITGIKTFTKKYPAGVLTNTNLGNFFENELTILMDSWLDRNALEDTLKVRKKILMVCDTNNNSRGADKVIIGNNKNGRSLGLIMYLLTQGFCKAKGIDMKDMPDIEWWTEDSVEETLQADTKNAGAEFGV